MKFSNERYLTVNDPRMQDKKEVKKGSFVVAEEPEYNVEEVTMRDFREKY